MGARDFHQASLVCSPGPFAPTSPVVCAPRACDRGFSDCLPHRDEGAALHRVACKPTILPPDLMRGFDTGKDGSCAHGGRDRSSVIRASLPGFVSPCRAGRAMPGTRLQHRTRPRIKHWATSIPPTMASGLPGGRVVPVCVPPTFLLKLPGVVPCHPRPFCERQSHE